MDCCATDKTSRPDRPHTFLLHEMSSCTGCGDAIEGRVVLRDGQVYNLVFCPECGQTETHVADDAKAYVEALLERGNVPEGHVGDYEFKRTTSTCPTCLQLIEAMVVFRNNKVYFVKDCQECGASEALVSEDSQYYASAYSYARAGTQPLQFASSVSHGCPTDCGTCDDHEQHTCLPIVEVRNGPHKLDSPISGFPAGYAAIDTALG